MLLRVLMFIGLLFLVPFAANAAGDIDAFEVEVLPAEGQKNFSEGYFHVDSEPGENLSLNFRVTNNSEKQLDFLIKPVDAFTAEKGGILYAEKTVDDEQGVIRMSDMIEVQEAVSVAPGSTETVHFHVVVPETAHGTMLGGILLSTEDAASTFSMEPTNKGGSNYTVEEPGQRLMAVKLNFPGKPSGVFSVAKAKFSDADNSVTIKIKNGKSAVIENVQGTYMVMDKDGNTIINGVIKPFAMAPLSEIDFPVDLKEKRFEQGKYILMIKGSADEKEFLAEEKFMVTENQEDGIVASTQEADSPSSRENISRTIAIALAALFLILPLLMKTDRKKEKNPVMDVSDKKSI